MSSALSHIGDISARCSLEASGVKDGGGEASATIVFLGSLSSLKTLAATFTIGANAPSGVIPSDLQITASAMKVASKELRGGPGGTGRLTIGLASESSEDQEDPSNEGEWQVEWTLVERRLELHPTFAPLFDPTSTSTYALASINLWKNIPDEYAANKAEFKIPDDLEHPTVWTALTGLALTFCQKLAKGIEAYQVQVPVVRKTMRKSSGPSNSNGSTCGQREDPPRFSGLATPGAWLKTADSWVKTGHSKWEHRQEWSGFDSLDPDIYPTGSSSSNDSSSSSSSESSP